MLVPVVMEEIVKAVLASLTASKNRCTRVTADHESSEKVFAEESKVTEISVVVGPSHDCTVKDQRCFFSVSLIDVLLQAKIETRNGLRYANKFVYKPTKWVTNSKVLAESLDRRCSNISGPSFHRHIVMDGGIAKTASACARQQDVR